jgi:hypothetical protein
MPADAGSIVHPWYKGVHEWVIKKIAKLDEPIEYYDSEQQNVRFDPKIMILEPVKASDKVHQVIWFPYWIITKDTNDKFRWGGGSALLEEKYLVELMSTAIKNDMFSKHFLRKLQEEIQAGL